MINSQKPEKAVKRHVWETQTHQRRNQFDSAVREVGNAVSIRCRKKTEKGNSSGCIVSVCLSMNCIERMTTLSVA